MERARYQEQSFHNQMITIWIGQLIRNASTTGIAQRSRLPYPDFSLNNPQHPLRLSNEEEAFPIASALGIVRREAKAALAQRIREKMRWPKRGNLRHYWAIRSQ